MYINSANTIIVCLVGRNEVMDIFSIETNGIEEHKQYPKEYGYSVEEVFYLIAE